MIVTAKIEKLENGKLVLKPDVDISRFLAQKRPRRVEVRLDDGRTISADQRRKIFAIIRDISLWSGQEPEELRLYLEWDFCSRCLREWFSLSNCDMTTAREFITYLIQFCFHWGGPQRTACSPRRTILASTCISALKIAGVQFATSLQRCTMLTAWAWGEIEKLSSMSG